MMPKPTRRKQANSRNQHLYTTKRRENHRPIVAHNTQSISSSNNFIGSYAAYITKHWNKMSWAQRITALVVLVFFLNLIKQDAFKKNQHSHSTGMRALTHTSSGALSHTNHSDADLLHLQALTYDINRYSALTREPKKTKKEKAKSSKTKKVRKKKQTTSKFFRPAEIPDTVTHFKIGEHYQYYESRDTNKNLNCILNLANTIVQIGADSHLGILQHLDRVYSVDPTGNKKLLRNGHGYTDFLQRFIVIDEKLANKGDFWLKVIMANELQHMIVILTNENLYSEITSHENINTMREPFSLKTKKTYLNMLNNVVDKLAKLDISYYIYHLPNPKQQEIARRYFQNLIGYDVKASRRLKDALIRKKTFTESARGYRNHYSLQGLTHQLYEFDSELASIYVILRKQDRSAMAEWVSYHQERMQHALANDKKPLVAY